MTPDQAAELHAAIRASRSTVRLIGTTSELPALEKAISMDTIAQARVAQLITEATTC